MGRGRIACGPRAAGAHARLAATRRAAASYARGLAAARRRAGRPGDGAELGDVGGAGAVAGARVAGDHSHADLTVVRHEDVRAMAGRVHPGGHDRPWRREVARARGEILADAPGPAARQISGGADAVGELGAVTAIVGEVLVVDHVTGL